MRIIILIVVLPIHENIGRRVNESRVGHSRSATVALQRCRPLIDRLQYTFSRFFSRHRLTNHNIISLSRHEYRRWWSDDVRTRYNSIILNIHALYPSFTLLKNVLERTYKFFHNLQTNRILQSLSWVETTAINGSIFRRAFFFYFILVFSPYPATITQKLESTLTM